MSEFVHLHNHSRMSIGDGLNSFEDIVKRTADIGQSAIAITDHYFMYNLPVFYYEALEQGIKPILGCELGIYPEGVAATLSKSDAEDNQSKSDQNVAYFHGVFLAKDYEGYQNLMRLASRGTNREDRFYKKPRVKRCDIRKYHKGLIFMSACVAGEIPQLILHGKEHEALKTAAWYKKIFGSDFYLEIQDHGIPDQAKVNKTLIEWSKRYKLQLALTNDCHYVTKDMDKYHKMLLCANWGYNYNDKSNPVHTKYFPTSEFYIKDDEEMKAIAKKWKCMDAYNNTAKIAAKCNVTIPKETHYPVAKLQFADNPDEELAILIERKKWDKYKQGDGCVITADGKKIEQAVFDERIHRELSDIKTGQVADYFLNVYYGITSYCHENDIMIGAGRGSAAGSVVSYILDISDVEPILLNLTWERFWNPGRMKRDENGNILEISLPDIDIDVPSDRRGEVIDHCKDYWGQDCVASIITFGTYSGRGLVNAISKATGFVESFKTTNEGFGMLKDIGNHIGGSFTASFENDDFLQELYNSNKKVKKLFDFCFPLEGCTTHVSNHAAGLLITDKTMTNYTPYTFGKHGMMAQYPFETLEKLGCLKVDLLGHEAEVVIDRACQYITDNHNIAVIPREIPTDDAKTFELLSKCDTLGIPQLESDWVQPIIRDVHPDKLAHVIDLITMIRPGSLDSGQTEKYRKIRKGEMKPKPDIPQVANITGDTLGVWLYQEQVMDVVKQIGGFTLGQADDLRKVVAKTKYRDKAEKLMDLFKKNSLSSGKVNEKEWKLLDDVIRKFFDYAFNKAHAAGYGITSYRCAWLKANYFIEYMTSLLNSTSKDKTPMYIDNAIEHGYDLSVPDINVSGFYWTCEDGVLRPPLSIITGCGYSAVNAIVTERDIHGKFKSFEDFLLRTQAKDVRQNVLENIICCGVFDGMGYARYTLYDAVHEHDYAREVRAGKGSLFGGKKSGLPLNEDDYDIEELQRNEDILMNFKVSLTDEEKEHRLKNILRSVRKYRNGGASKPDKGLNNKAGINSGSAAERLERKLAMRKQKQEEEDEPARDDIKSSESFSNIKSKLKMRQSQKAEEAHSVTNLKDVYVRIESDNKTIAAKVYATLRKYVSDPEYVLTFIVQTASGDNFKLETEYKFNKLGYEKLKKLFDADSIWLE